MNLIRLFSIFIILLFCACAQEPKKIEFKSTFFFFDSKICSLKEYGYEKDISKKRYEGEKLRWLCSVKIPKEIFEQEYDFCSVNGHGVDKMAGKTVEESFLSSNHCSYATYGSDYVFQRYGNINCSFACYKAELK